MTQGPLIYHFSSCALSCVSLDGHNVPALPAAARKIVPDNFRALVKGHYLHESPILGVCQIDKFTAPSRSQKSGQTHGNYYNGTFFLQHKHYLYYCHYKGTLN